MNVAANREDRMAAVDDGELQVTPHVLDALSS